MGGLRCGCANGTGEQARWGAWRMWRSRIHQPHLLEAQLSRQHSRAQPNPLARGVEILPSRKIDRGQWGWVGRAWQPPAARCCFAERPRTRATALAVDGHGALSGLLRAAWSGMKTRLYP